MIFGPLPKTHKTCGPLLINKNTYLCFGFFNITAELLNKGLCSCPPENRSVDPMGGRGPRLKNHVLDNCAVLLSAFCIIFEKYHLLTNRFSHWHKMH